MATNEIDSEGVWGHDAHALEQSKRYVGHLFLDSRLHNSSLVLFSKATFSSFDATDLELVPGELRFRQVRNG
ncbi:MAG TPA: hypothetical protein VI685_28180 [Candidatus Angelobacter sp.]